MKKEKEERDSRMAVDRSSTVETYQYGIGHSDEKVKRKKIIRK